MWKLLHFATCSHGLFWCHTSSKIILFFVFWLFSSWNFQHTHSTYSSSTSSFIIVLLYVFLFSNCKYLQLQQNSRHMIIRKVQSTYTENFGARPMGALTIEQHILISKANGEFCYQPNWLIKLLRRKTPKRV